MIFERRGGQGETSPYKQIFQIPAPGGFGKIGACEGTQAVLAVLLPISVEEQFYRLFCFTQLLECQRGLNVRHS